MMISGHKTQSIFDPCNIISPYDLKQAASRMESYLHSQSRGHNLGTIRDLPTRKNVGHDS